MYLTGTEGDDVLVGGPDADTLVGLGGNDTLQGGDGDDLLIGGSGHNTLDGGAGSDTVSYEDAAPVGMFGFLMINLTSQSVSIVGPAPATLDTLVSIENAIGSSGNDWLVGSTGDNHLSGGAGNDNIEGKGGADVLDGGAGNDSISTLGMFSSVQPGSLMIGGDGNDSLQSGNSNDTMLGGAGDDVLSIGNFTTTRILDGGDGVDTLILGNSPTEFASGGVVDLGNTGAQTVATGVVITVSNIENVYGSEAADTLTGDAGANLLKGNGGNDSLHGGDGNDILIGGTGQDTLEGGAGADTFIFSPGDSAPTAPDTITDFTSQDVIRFTDGPYGSSANFVALNAPDLAAVDALFAGDGVRYVAMQSGADVYLFADTGAEGTTYDQVIVLAGVNVSTVHASSIIG